MYFFPVHLFMRPIKMTGKLKSFSGQMVILARCILLTVCNFELCHSNETLWHKFYAYYLFLRIKQKEKINFLKIFRRYL